MIKLDVLNRFTKAVQFTAEIDCDEDVSVGVKLGLAIKWAIKERADLAGADLAGAYLTGAYLTGANLTGADLARADLAGAYLTGADLAGANLTGAYLARADLASADLAGADLAGAYLAGANLARANLTDGGQRSDGYRFVGQVKDSVLWIKAGCRYFTIDEARAHWEKTRGGTPLGDESLAIVDHLERVARIRGWLK